MINKFYGFIVFVTAFVGCALVAEIPPLRAQSMLLLTAGKSSGGGGSFSFIQATNVNTLSTGLTTQAVSFGSLPAVGHKIIVLNCWPTSTGYGTLTVTDNQSNSYSALGLATNTGTYEACEFFGANVVTSSGTFTVTGHSTVVSNGNGVFVAIAEYSGLTLTVDTSNSSGGSAGLCGSITTAHASDLILCGTDVGGSSFAAGSGYTMRTFGTTNNGGLEDNTVSATGTYAPTFTGEMYGAAHITLAIY